MYSRHNYHHSVSVTPKTLSSSLHTPSIDQILEQAAILRNMWIVIMISGVIAIIALGGCGGDSDTGDPNPGGITAEQAGERVKRLVIADGCDSPPPTYSSVTAEGGKWKLKAAIGLVSFSWTYDPVANTVVEDNGRCASS